MAPRSGQLVPLTDEEYELFRRLIYEKSGIVLTERRRQLISTRLSGRLRQLGFSCFLDYYAHLQAEDRDGEEMRSMLNAMTTNKTSFFRENHHFTFLREVLISAGGEPLRLWSAGCSTGEEPYSIAMVLREAGADARGARLLASDLDTDVLSHAEQGVYPEDRMEPVPPDLLRRHFLRGVGQWQGYYRARDELRSLIRFRRLNFMEADWPVRTTFQAIFCRNVLIYFDRETQERLVGRLSEHLQPGGYLFLGHAESMLGMRAGLVHLGQTIYQRPGGT